MENVVVNGIGHHNQVDQAALTGWDICVSTGKWPRTFFAEVYLLHSKLWLSFLANIEKKNDLGRDAFFDSSEAEEYVQSYSEKWLKYDIVFEQ